MSLDRYQVNDALTNLATQAGLEIVDEVEATSENTKSTITYDALNDLTHYVSDALGIASTMSNNAIDEPCEGFLCSPEQTCHHHNVNVSEIEGRGHEDIIEPPAGSVVLVEGVALQRGLIPNDEEGAWTYFYDLQPQYAEWKDIAKRTVLIYKADKNWKEGSVWQEGMPA